MHQVFKPAALAIVLACVSTPALAYVSVVAPRACIAQWPQASIREGESGTVTLLIQVGANGRMMDARIATSSGSQKLDHATIQAASTCRFRPLVESGVNIPAWFQLKHEWKPGTPAIALARPRLECARPEWPDTRSIPQEAPSVQLALLIDINGRVVDSKIEQSSGMRIFDSAALAALSKCFYAPAMEDGKPVQRWITQRYNFWLD